MELLILSAPRLLETVHFIETIDVWCVFLPFHSHWPFYELPLIL